MTWTRQSVCIRANNRTARQKETNKKKGGKGTTHSLSRGSGGPGVPLRADSALRKQIHSGVKKKRSHSESPLFIRPDTPAARRDYPALWISTRRPGPPARSAHSIMVVRGFPSSRSLHLNPISTDPLEESHKEAPGSADTPGFWWLDTW